MKKILRNRARLAATAAAIGLWAAGCASAKPAPPQPDDAGIEAEVSARLDLNAATNPFEIGVAVSEGVVHLTGLVDVPAARDEAEKVARGVSGVRQVLNDLEVGAATAGETLDDAAITAKVRAKLAASAELHAFDVQVDTVRGVMSLSGRVGTAEQREIAERIARSTSGVRKVVNQLAVGEPP